MTIEFISYLTTQLSSKNYREVAIWLNFSEKDIKRGENFIKKQDFLKYEWVLKTKDINFSSLGISKQEIERIRSIKKFRPWSVDAQILFSIALKIAWLPSGWNKNINAHNIMKKESAWDVGVLNYTIKWMSTSEYKKKALSLSKKNPIGSSSTASWLGQLLLLNIDKFYPSWRAWIWDPIEEAVWYLSYIHERYWDPDVADSMYNKIGWYTNSRTWKSQYKWFEEWY
jgi:hypothetical protein